MHVRSITMLSYHELTEEKYQPRLDHAVESSTIKNSTLPFSTLFSLVLPTRIGV